jgi:hypothetical protein
MFTRRLAGLVAAVVAAAVPTACRNADSDAFTGPRNLAASPQSYVMNIEGAGLADIDGVDLDDTTIRIEYSYSATDGTGEQRAGSMTLQLRDGQGRSASAKGTWATDATNGSTYSGTLDFTFAETGDARGRYQFNGRSYPISIRRQE